MCSKTVEWSRFILHLSWVTGVQANHEYPMLASNTYGVGHCNSVAGVWVWQPWGPHVARWHLLELRIWLRRGRVTAPRRLWPPEELAALSEGAGSSFTSGLIICAMTGWFCLSCMILVMAWMKALGLLPKLLPPLVADLTQWQWAFLPRLSWSGLVFQPVSAPGWRLLCFHTGFVPLFYRSLCQWSSLWWDSSGRWGSQCREECTIGQCSSGHCCKGRNGPAYVAVLHLIGRGCFLCDGWLWVRPQLL